MIEKDALVGSDRAEDLTPEQVLELFADSRADSGLVARLMVPGVVLLQGSRGTGKTMLLRVAYERLKKATPRNTLPVFISFSRYLATYNPTALSVPGYRPFQHWVLAKILDAMQSSARELGFENTNPGAFGVIPLQSYVSRLESHYSDASVGNPSENARVLGVSNLDILEFARLDHLVLNRILPFLDSIQVESVAFFLDEAAQSFAEELQPDFFQLVKHLRSHRISVKAAVYPNTTNYGRDFDVGHDAIIVPIERHIEGDDAMSQFRELVEKRFSGTDLGRKLDASSAQLDFLIKMSGGNPRWLIHLINGVAFDAGTTISSSRAISAAKEFPDNTLWPYLKKIRDNLSSKRKYVESATQLAQVFVETLRDANRHIRQREGSERPVCYVAVSTNRTVPYRVHAAIQLLLYAGILSDRGPKKITGRETAEMFLLHPAILVRENALFGSEMNPTVEAVVAALRDPPRERMREFTRNSPKLLEFRGQEKGDELLCANCATALPEVAKFCMSCGTPVLTTSPYQELLSRPSSELELPPRIKQRILDDGNFPTVGSVVSATDKQLDAIAWIGPTRVALIRYAAEEFLAG